MAWLTELGRRFWMLTHRQQFDADLEEEVRLHLELREQEQMQAGLAPKEAAGSFTAIRERDVVEGEKSHGLGMGVVGEFCSRYGFTAAARCCAALRSPSSPCSRSL
jgi:hypothetical protein